MAANNYSIVRQHFLQKEERCRVRESSVIVCGLHHKDTSCKHNDTERYNQRSIKELLPMASTAHLVIPMTGKKNHNYGKHLSEETGRKLRESKVESQNQRNVRKAVDTQNQGEQKRI